MRLLPNGSACAPIDRHVLPDDHGYVSDSNPLVWRGMEHSKVNVTTIRKEKICRDLQELPPELRGACEEELAKQTGGARVMHCERGWPCGG